MVGRTLSHYEILERIVGARVGRTRDALVFSRTEQTGNIWLAEW